MQRSPRLYEFLRETENIPRGLELVVALTGYTDAGGASGQFLDYLRSRGLDTIARFDNDRLLDYRARRPIITFDEDHLTDYAPPRLELSLATDELARPFLVLSGYEPDFAWEAFTDAVIELIDFFAIKRMTWTHAIPMPVPHTRPIGITVSGNRDDLVESLSLWRPHTQIPATVLHLLEFRLTERHTAVGGLALLSPHYLAESQNPELLLAALTALSEATGLIFPTDRVRDAAREFGARVNLQVAENEELARLVSTLEERYDDYVRDGDDAAEPRSVFESAEGELPSADDIAEELERFLAGRGDDDDSASSDGV